MTGPTLDLTQRREHRLPDGRTLTYAVWGDAGPAIFHHHGTGSSRFEAAALARAAAGLSVRVIGVDRPGYGGSTPDPKRTLMSFHADVERLATALGVDRFFVSGVSGGADFACAAALSPRVIKVYPLNMSPDPGHPAYARVSLLLRILIPLMMKPKPMVKAARKAAPEPLARVEALKKAPIDKAVLLEEIPDIWTAAIREAGREGFSGVARDVELVSRPWPLDWKAQIVPIEIHAGLTDPFRGWAHALADLQAGVSVVDHPGGHVAALGRGFMRPVIEDVLKQG